MHPDLEKMIVLQRVDVELRKLLEETQAIPARIAALAARSAEAQAALLRVEEALAREEAGRRGLQLEVKTLHERELKLRKQMDVVTTTAQVAALENEIKFLGGEVHRLEDEELLSMERTERFEAQLPAAQEAVRGTEANLELARLSGADRGAWIGERAAELGEERMALRRSFAETPTGEASLGTYDRISKSRGTAVAEGVDGKCSACQMVVRPQRWNDLRDRLNDQLMLSCEHCGRLLYWDPARDAPQKKPVAAAAGTRPGQPAAAGRPQLGETKPADRQMSIAERIVRGL